MTTTVVSVLPDDSILEVLRLLTNHRISGLPVADEENNLVGVITEKDVLKLLFEDTEKRFVHDFMSKNVTAFQVTESIDAICKFFIKSPIRRVPIVDENDKLVGVISRRDIIAEIKRIRGI